MKWLMVHSSTSHSSSGVSPMGMLPCTDSTWRHGPSTFLRTSPPRNGVCRTVGAAGAGGFHEAILRRGRSAHVRGGPCSGVRTADAHEGGTF
eukprot:1407206-Amphidinium_carterae.1